MDTIERVNELAQSIFEEKKKALESQKTLQGLQMALKRHEATAFTAASTEMDGEKKRWTNDAQRQNRASEILESNSDYQGLRSQVEALMEKKRAGDLKIELQEHLLKNWQLHMRMQSGDTVVVRG